MANSSEHEDNPSGSGATELVNLVSKLVSWLVYWFVSWLVSE
jgi:hypothetical protein